MLLGYWLQLTKRRKKGKIKYILIEEANKVINRFCEERNFYIRYKRKWKKGGVTYVDVASHTEFFHIVEEGKNGLFY